MNTMELARLKIERAITLSKDYDRMDEQELRQMLLCLHNGLFVLPKKDQEWSQLYNITTRLLNMGLTRYGHIFKASSWKDTMMLSRQDVVELVWRAHSLLS